MEFHEEYAAKIAAQKATEWKAANPGKEYIEPEPEIKEIKGASPLPSGTYKSRPPHAL